MKILVLPLLFLSWFSYSQSIRANEISSNNDRYVIDVNGKKGFIDHVGTLVIKPQFREAVGFSEGLCAVRTDGLYGFINTEGVLCIAATFEYATTFSDGLALVYRDGKSQFINTSGEVAFSSDYKQMSSFINGRAYVKTHSGRLGMINREGKLIVDTIYSSIGGFHDGFAVVEGVDHRTEDSDGKKRNLQISVIDSIGQMLFPYGKFESIEVYDKGNFNVNFSKNQRSAILNSKGEVVFSLKNNKGWIYGINNNIVHVSLPANKRSGTYYDAYLTLKGELVYGDKHTETGTDFRDNVALVADEDYKYSLINRRGQLVSTKKFRIGSSLQNPFHNGIALVKFEDDTWEVIDTTAKTVLKTTFSNIYRECLVDNQFLFFQNENDSDTYGLADLKGKIIIQPILQDFDANGFINGLLKARVDNKITYFDRNGKIVWQDVADKQLQLAPLNIDFMNRGYFIANYDYTGHACESSHTEPKVIDNSATLFPKGALSIMVSRDDTLTFFSISRGMHVNVANTTADTIVFNAQDNRLYMKIQAKDKDGTWRDIEYLPRSWCGNSYHTVQLPPSQYWSFVAPVYEGIFATTMRIALTYLDGSDKSVTAQDAKRWSSDRRELTQFSDEFPGSVNPAQFWRRPGYSPAGIMDPYNE